MELDVIQFSFSLVISIFIALVAVFFWVLERKPKPHPDYDNAIPVIDIVEALEKICPISYQNKWMLFPLDHGCHRCWSQALSEPFLQSSINLYGSAAKVNSSSESICSMIGNVAKWPEWNPFFTSQYILKPFHDKALRRDCFMEAERVISIVQETDKIRSRIIMYRFHHFSENKVGQILFWNPQKIEFLYFLIQPVKDRNENRVCLLTHIMGTESKLSASSIPLVSQRLRNIQDFLTLSSLCTVSTLHSSQKDPISEEQTDQLNSNSQEYSFSLSSAKALKKEARNAMFILVPFIQSVHSIWKTTIEYKLAIKSIEPISSHKGTSLAVSSKGNVSDNKDVPKPLRRTVSDIGFNPETLANLNKDCNSADNHKDSLVPKNKLNSESKNAMNNYLKQKSDSTSEDSDAKNMTSWEKNLSKTKLRSFSETAVNITNSKGSSKSVNSGSDHESFSKLEDVSETDEDKLLALDEEDNKEIFNSSEDFEEIESYEFVENRLASFMTQGNYGAAELQAEVLVASQFLFDMNSGNYESIGGWMFHSYYKGLCVLKKTTCSKFLTISSFLCQTEIPVAPKDVWKLVKCPQFRFVCDVSVKSVETLEKISNSQKLIYTYHEVSGFVKKELVDFCLLQTEREEVNKYYSCFCSIEYDKCPLMKSVTRGILRPSGWIVEKVNDDPHKSIVTYVIQGLINSPDSLFIQELSTTVPQSVHNLKNYITSKPV